MYSSPVQHHRDASLEDSDRNLSQFRQAAADLVKGSSPPIFVCTLPPSCCEHAIDFDSALPLHLLAGAMWLRSWHARRLLHFLRPFLSAEGYYLRASRQSLSSTATQADVISLVLKGMQFFEEALKSPEISTDEDLYRLWSPQQPECAVDFVRSERFSRVDQKRFMRLVPASRRRPIISLLQRFRSYAKACLQELCNMHGSPAKKSVAPIVCPGGPLTQRREAQDIRPCPQRFWTTAAMQWHCARDHRLPVPSFPDDDPPVTRSRRKRKQQRPARPASSRKRFRRTR